MSTISRPVRGLLNVARHKDDLSARLLDQLSRFLRVLVFAQVGNQQVRALPRVGQCNRPANTAVSAGNDGALAGKTPRPLV